MPEKKTSKQEGPEILAKIGKFEVVSWEEGRYQIRKRAYNPTTQKWETQRINLTAEEIPVFLFIAEEVLRAEIRWFMRKPAREEEEE